MGTAPPAGTTGLTYRDLLDLPSEGGTRFELLDGELLVTPSPATRHQDSVLHIGAALLAYTRRHGGRVAVAPIDVWFSDETVFQPDVVALATQHTGQVGSERIVGPPRVVLEDGGVRSSVLADFVMPAEEVLARTP